MHSLPAKLVYPDAPDGEYVAFYGWNASGSEDGTDYSYVNFAISQPGSDGLEWKNCRVARIPADDGGLGAFTVADNDRDGNMYLTYSDTKAYHSYLTTLTADKVRDCTGANTAVSKDLPSVGWSDPVQVDRGAIRNTVFPWLAADGEPGRVAVAFYGTETNGNANTGAFKASWDVYVNQSLNALSPRRRSARSRRPRTRSTTTRSACTGSAATSRRRPATARWPTSSRSTTTRDEEADGRLRPEREAARRGGGAHRHPGGGHADGRAEQRRRTVEPDTRPVVRDSSTDPDGDATADYSNTAPFPTGPPSPSPTNVPAMDLRSQQVGPEVDPATGAGARRRLHGHAEARRPLRRGAAGRPTKTKSGSLLWIFRFVNGYTASAASARWSPAEGFSFGYNDYTVRSAQCGSSGDKCQVYPGDQPLKGKVDQAAGTITLSVPREYLKGLCGPTGPGQRPALTKAEPGTRFYDATAFSLGNSSPTRPAVVPVPDRQPAGDGLPAARAGARDRQRRGGRCGPRRRGRRRDGPQSGRRHAGHGLRRHGRLQVGRGHAAGPRPALRLRAPPARPAGDGRCLPRLPEPAGPGPAPGGALREPAQGLRLERALEGPARGPRLLLRPARGADVRRALGAAAGDAREDRRALRAPARVRAARALRDAAVVQARPAGVRRAHGDAAQRVLPARAASPGRAADHARIHDRAALQGRDAGRQPHLPGEVPARALRRGVYRVRISVVRGRRTTRGAITGRRL